MSTESFVVAIPESTLADLQERLAVTRSIPGSHEADWAAGTSPAYLQSLIGCWRTEYDWRAQEALINQFAHFRARVGGTTVHFVHERGHGDAPLPIVLTHGFPDSFLRFSKLIPMLTDPAAHGGEASDAFDVVAPTTRAPPRPSTSSRSTDS